MLPLDPLALRDELKKYEFFQPLILHPGLWESYDGPTELVWERVPFSDGAMNDVPSAGRAYVYSFVVEPGLAGHGAVGYLAYIGKAEATRGLRRRFADYLSEAAGKETPRPLMNRLFSRWREHLWFYFAAVPKGSIAGELEKQLTAALQPPCVVQDFRAKIRTARKMF